MDIRTALPVGTQLTLTNHEGGTVRYTIQGEIGRGGSSIVYDASYTNTLGDARIIHIKECYPFGLRITRDSTLCLQPSQEDEQAFQAHNKQADRSLSQAE